MAHPIVHARDVQLFIEDSGPYILGLGACFLRLFFELIPKLTSTLSPSLSFFADTECKYITKIATDICVVDLDIVCLLSPFLPSSLSLPREHLELISFCFPSNRTSSTSPLPLSEFSQPTRLETRSSLDSSKLSETGRDSSPSILFQPSSWFVPPSLLAHSSKAQTDDSSPSSFFFHRKPTLEDDFDLSARRDHLQEIPMRCRLRGSRLRCGGIKVE